MKKQFALDQPLALPHDSELHRHYVANRIVLIVPDRPTWIVVTETEDQLYRSLSTGDTLRSLVARYGREAVTSLVAKIDHARFYRQDSSGERQLPRLLTLSLTNRCNLRCKHCYASAGMPLADELKEGEWHSVLDEFGEMAGPSEVTVTGGEPTVVAYFWAVAEHIKTDGHRLVVFTNGTNLDESAIDRLSGSTE